MSPSLRGPRPPRAPKIPEGYVKAQAVFKGDDTATPRNLLLTEEEWRLIALAFSEGTSRGFVGAETIIPDLSLIVYIRRVAT